MSDFELLTNRTRTQLFPLTVTDCPVPLMVRSSLMAGGAVTSVMVPLMLKVMVSAAPGVRVFASSMA